MTNLEKDVMRWEGSFDNILKYGCQMIGELKYRDDAAAFYVKHREEINELLFEPTFDGLWDKGDPLSKHNQMLLAWAGVEQTVRNLRNRNLKVVRLPIDI